MSPLLIAAIAAAPGLVAEPAAEPGAALVAEPFAAPVIDLDDLEHRVTRQVNERYVADLEEVKRRGLLRVLTRNDSSGYFVARGRERGFQYELAKAFAESLGVVAVFIVPESREALMEALLAGEGDLLAAGLTSTPARAEKVRLTRPVHTTERVIAAHRHAVKLLERPEDLLAFELHLSFRSSTLRDARALEQEAGGPLRLVDVRDGVEMEELIRRVGSGEYEATVADRDQIDLARAAGVPVVARLGTGRRVSRAWAVHPSAPDLEAAANAFLKKTERRGLVRVLYKRYFRSHTPAARTARDSLYRADVQGRLSPWDELFRAAGVETGIDWRLLAALAYTESRFDPGAKSAWGAVGLMQILPSTAAELGLTDLERPSGNIRAGARYLRWLVRQFQSEGIEERQQIRFALAAYNAGLGHIADARALATLTGRDPNRWFGHVEEALRLKQDRRWHARTRYGYCRAEETIAFVSAVQARYDLYARHVLLETPEE